MDSLAAQIVAQVLGPLYIVAALGMFTQPDRFAKLVADMEANPPQILVAGMAVLALGLLILAFHSAWRADWTVIVTLIGWAATIKGALLILAPDLLLRMTRKLFRPPDKLRVWAAGPLVLGGFLTAMGYGPA